MIPSIPGVPWFIDTSLHSLHLPLRCLLCVSAFSPTVSRTQVFIFSVYPCGSAGKEPACNAGDLGSIPGLGRSPGEGKGYPLQYSGLENSMDYTIHGVAKSQTRLSAFHFHPKFWGISSLDPQLSSSVWMLSHSVVSDSLQHYGLQSPRLLCPWDALLQVIFPTQGLNWCLLHSCIGRWVPYH